MTLKVSGGEICSVNTKQFWFEHNPAGHKLRSVVLLAFFTRKKTIEVGFISLKHKTNSQRPFNNPQKSMKIFLAFWRANSEVLLFELQNKKLSSNRDTSALRH